MSAEDEPKRFEVLIGDGALEDLRLMREYISERLAEPGAARRTVSGILDVIESLDTMPARNHTVGTTANGSEIRQARWGKYAILYFVDGKTVRVAAVIYGARDLGNLIAKITA